MALRSSVILDLQGNFARRAKAFQGSMNRFSRTSRRDLKLLGRSTAVAGRRFDRLGTRLGALATGAAGVGAVRGVVSLERRMTRLGIQSSKSAEEIERLKGEIFAAAQAPDIRIDPSQITSAIEKIVEKTGDLEFARKNIRAIAAAINATGGAGRDIGALVAEFRKFGVDDAVLNNLDTLIRQGKAGAFTVADLATQGERLVSAYAATGRVGPKAVRELGAVIQVIKSGVGAPEQAATAFEAVLRTLQDADKIKQLQREGIRIFEPDQPDVMRSVVEIMTDIVRKTQGSIPKISQVFDSEALRAFNNIASGFKKTGTVDAFDRFLKIQGDGKDVLKDSARAARDAAAAVQSLKTAWQQFGDAQLSVPVKKLADQLNRMTPAQQQALIGGSLAAGALVLARKPIVGLSKRAARIVSAGKVGAGAASGKGVLGRASRFGRFLGPLSGVLAGIETADIILGNDSRANKILRGGKLGGILSGALAGGKLGAIGGTAFGPIGTLVGGGAGAIGGGIIGDELGEIMARAFNRALAENTSRSSVTLDINLSGARPVTRVTRIDDAGGPQVDVNTGPTLLP